MAKFIFKLEGVLRQRKQLERMKQREMAVVQAEMNALQEQIRSLDSSVQTATEDVRKNRLTGVLDMSFLAAHRRFMNSVQRQGTLLVQKTALVQRRLDEARLAVAEAAKQRKIIEKLREKRFDEWKAERSRKELADADEVTMQLTYWNSQEDAEEDAEEIEGEIAT